ncbi:MAG: symporter small accessory protein [Moorellales bacterium]
MWWGLGDFGVWLGYVGSILATFLCILWGIRYWNHDL